MKPLSGKEIRQRWIKFFESKGHRYIPGVSLIPQGDKSLLWVNAGVTGLKKYFDGTEVPPSRRIVNVQKSIRTNDIENVGHTARHHTFFEMLGNFSIGDYFRAEVIPWAYELLTSEEVGFGFPVEKLYITHNPMDEATRDLWIRCGIPADHLIPLEGNFWEIGEGPCGPDTEIFFDRGEKYDPDHLGRKLLEEDLSNDRYIEIWNIVFSQYNSENGVARKDYKELPSKNIDTGSGLERIASILQDAPTNFETDLFMPIIREIERISGKKYERDNLMSFRVIADHARCLTFALSDGATFSNEGRGYVLRRIIRRAMRYGRKLGLNEPFMHRLVKKVIEIYEDFYPELLERQSTVEKMIKSEEEKFIKTLLAGLDMLNGLLVAGKKMLEGGEIFKLYDTYGFPYELTIEIAGENGIDCDIEGFNQAMEEQRRKAREARVEIESFHKQSADLLAFKEESSFSYEEDELESVCLGLFMEGEKVDEVSSSGEAIFKETPFYAEMGGQVADTGTIKNDDFEANVTYVGKAPNGQHLHHIEVLYGTLKVGDEATLSINVRNRRLTERNHSATHLLHTALGKVLNTHVDQRGSYVDMDYLRFDFSFPRKLTKEEVRSVEKEVNEKIAEAIKEQTLVLNIEEAKKRGAEMEFGEKYGETVRVVEFSDYSREFCGGTHVKNSSDIGSFVIVSEESIASGVRRIEARTSLGAYNYLRNRTSVLEENEAILGASDVDFANHIKSIMEKRAMLEKTMKSMKERLASEESKAMAVSFQKVEGINVGLFVRQGTSREDLLLLGDRLKNLEGDYLIVLIGGESGAYPCVVYCGGKTLEKVDANKIVKLLASELGGSGGGRKEMANGQLKSLSKADEIYGKIKDMLK